MTLRDHVVALVVPISLALVLSLPLFDRLQGLSIDLLFLLRNSLVPSAVEPQAPAVAVITIDEASRNTDVATLRDMPWVFWTQALAEVLEAVVEGEAAVVGFDLIPNTSVERLAKDPGFEKPFRAALFRAARAGKVILGARTIGDQSVLPHPVYQRVVRGENIRSVNAVVDSDGVVRFMPLQFRDAESDALVPSMSLEIATRVLGVSPEVDRRDGSLWLDGFRVPAALDPQLTVRDDGEVRALRNDLLVDLHQGPASFQTHSFIDLYLCLGRDGSRAFFERNFAGKAVLIGVATDVEDRKSTAVRFSQQARPAASVERCATPEEPSGSAAPRSRIPGVYLHAAAISNLVEGKVLRPPERHEQVIATALLAVLIAVLAMRLKAGLAAAAFIGASLGWAALALGGFVAGFVVPVSHPIAAGGLTLASLLGYRFAVTDRLERHVRRAFGRVLSPTLVERMVKTRQVPTQGGELREITVWMSDLANFTTISEILPPTELVAFLNEIYTVMCDTVEEYDGFVAQFIGDAVVAGFNVPLDDRDHARHGVEAAIVCVRRVERLREEMELPEGFELRIRIGISTGSLLAGYIGSKRRLSYTMIGDDINLASRLEGVNKLYGSTILVNQVTAELCEPGIVFREIDTVRVKGRDAPVRMFEPLGLRDEVTDQQHEMARTFAEALSLFRSRRFEEAAAVFDRLAASDPVSRSFAERSRALIADPPPSDWDGVNNLLTK